MEQNSNASTNQVPATWPICQGPPTVAIVLSQPRLCFTDQSVCIMQAISQIPNCTVVHSGGYPWEAALTKGINWALAFEPDYLLFCDYDGVFSSDDVIDMINAMQAHPEFGAMYPIQAHRHKDGALTESKFCDYSGPYTETPYAHFGLTLIRRQVFEHLDAPWFWGMPDPETYQWSGRDCEADMFFWRQLYDKGIRVARNNNVQIGHMELCAWWLDEKGQRVYQPLNEYRRDGKPASATWRGPPTDEKLKAMYEDAERSYKAILDDPETKEVMELLAKKA